jgi:hypothetical protein
MSRHELLNNVTHRDLRVGMRFGREYGDAVAVVPAFPTEFAELQREYPIFFRRDRDSGAWQAVALLGFARGENLFLQDGRWNAHYLPGAVAKGPFLIGFQQQRVDGALRTEPVIHVDLDHPRVSTTEGEAVFLPHGGHSPYLEHVTTVLRGIREGSEAMPAMFEAFESAGLIQPVRLDVRFDDAHGANLSGLHGIDRERLAALDAATLHRLHQAGWLEGAHLVLASLHNVRRLMAEKQRRLQQGDPVAPGRAA